MAINFKSLIQKLKNVPVNTKDRTTSNVAIKSQPSSLRTIRQYVFIIKVFSVYTVTSLDLTVSPNNFITERNSLPFFISFTGGRSSMLMRA